MFLFSDQPSGYGEASEKPHSLVHVLLHSFRTHLLLLHRWSHTAPSQSFLMSQKSQQIWGENTETNMFNLRLVMRNQGQSTLTLASLRVAIFRIGILKAMDRIIKLKEIKKTSTFDCFGSANRWKVREQGSQLVSSRGLDVGSLPLKPHTCSSAQRPIHPPKKYMW